MCRGDWAFSRKNEGVGRGSEWRLEQKQGGEKLPEKSKRVGQCKYD